MGRSARDASDDDAPETSAGAGGGGGADVPPGRGSDRLQRAESPAGTSDKPQDVGGRMEKAADDVVDQQQETGETAVCCWRTQQACAETNTDPKAALDPCIKCRFYFHHKCAVRNGCEESNCSTAAVSSSSRASSCCRRWLASGAQRALRNRCRRRRDTHPLPSVSGARAPAHEHRSGARRGVQLTLEGTTCDRRWGQGDQGDALLLSAPAPCRTIPATPSGRGGSVLARLSPRHTCLRNACT